MTDEDKNRAGELRRKTMTREERAKDYAEHNIDKYTNDFANLYNAYLKGAKEETKELEKENAELKERISVLLSCKNCPENKSGWVCVKEYENKCLAQKIEFIKELKKEKCELLGLIQAKDELIKKMKRCYNCKFDIDNGWLKHQPCLSCKNIINGSL